MSNNGPKETGADETDPFAGFINVFPNEDGTLNTYGTEPLNMDPDANTMDEMLTSAMNSSNADLSSQNTSPTNPGTFPDFENQDIIMITSDADPFGTAPVSASAVMDLSGGDSLTASNSSDFLQARKCRRDKAKRPANKPPPANAEIIDLDSMQVKDIHIKSEDGDVTFIKAEPGTNHFAQGFIKWPNTKDNPHCLDDDDDDEPPPPGPSLASKIQQTAKKNDNKSASPRLEDVPMRDVPARDANAPSDEFGITQSVPTEDHTAGIAAPDVPMEIEPGEDAPSPRAAVSEPRSSDEMEVESATGSNNGNTLEGGRATAFNASASSPNLGNSALTPKNGPFKRGGVMDANMRSQLKNAGKLFKMKNQRKQLVPNGGASAVPGPLAGLPSSTFALPTQPATSGPSSAQAGPPAPSMPAVTSANPLSPRAPAPEFPTSFAGPSAQYFDNDPSIEDEYAEMNADMQNHLANDTYSDEYLDAVQKLKDRRQAYQARGEKDEVAEIEFMKAQTELDGWKKRLEEDKQYDQTPEEDSLFVQDDFDDNSFEALTNYNNGSAQRCESELHANPRGRPNGSSGKKGKVGKSNIGRPAKGKNNNDKIKDKTGKVSKKAPKSKKGRGGPTGVNNNHMLNIGSLFTSNVFQAAQANQGLGQLPVMTSTHRNLALKQLVASVPLEHRKMALIDKNYLDRACRDFVGRAVKAVPGNDGWEVSGMTCVLKHHQLLGRLSPQV